MGRSVKKWLIGGAATIVALLAGYYFFVRRRRAKQPEQQPPKDAEKKATKLEEHESREAQTPVAPQPISPASGVIQSAAAAQEILEKNKQLQQETETPVEPEDKWREFVNEQLGISFRYPGYVALEQGECFYLLKLHTHDTESYTQLIIQPHEGLSLEQFTRKSFEDLKVGLNIEAQDLVMKQRTISGLPGLELQYTYVYPNHITQKYWSAVVAMNNNVYMFQHFSPDWKYLDIAKQVLDSLRVFESHSAGYMNVLVDQFEFQLPSLHFRRSNPVNKEMITAYTVMDNTRPSTVSRAIELSKIQKLNTIDALAKFELLELQHLEKTIQSDMEFKHHHLIVGGFRFFDFLAHENEETYDATNVCFATSQSGYTLTLKQLRTPENNKFLSDALQQLANSFKVLNSVVQQETLSYTNTVYNFTIQFPAEKLSLFSEHLENDPVITFWHMDESIVMETNVTCAIPEITVEDIGDVRESIKDGLVNPVEESAGKVKILEESEVTVQGVPGVRYIYLQTIQYSDEILKWMLTSLVANGKVYHVRSYTFGEQWTPVVAKSMESIHQSFKILN